MMRIIEYFTKQLFRFLVQTKPYKKYALNMSPYEKQLILKSYNLDNPDKYIMINRNDNILDNPRKMRIISVDATSQFARVKCPMLGKMFVEQYLIAQNDNDKE